MAERWTNELDDMLLKMEAEGVKHSVMAKRVGRTESAVANRLAIIRESPRSIRREEALELYRSGVRYSEVVRITGISPSALNRAIKNSEVKP